MQYFPDFAYSIFQELASTKSMDYHVLHHTPGRLRLQISRIRHDRSYGQTLENLLLALPLVLETRLNCWAASLLIHYTAPGLPPFAVEHLIGQCLEQAAATPPLPLAEPWPTPTPAAIRAWEAEVEAQQPPESDWQRLGWPWLSFILALLAAPWDIPPVVVGGAVLGGAWPWWQRTQTRWQAEQRVSEDALDLLWLGLHTLNGEFIAPALKTALAAGRADIRDHVTALRPYPALLLNPDQGIVIDRQGQSRHLTLAELQVGDRLWLEAGQVIPVDGPVVAGTGMLGLVHREQRLTTVSVESGCFIYAGSQLLSGRIQVEAQRCGWQTRIGLVTELRQAEPVYDSQIAQAQAHLAQQAVLPTLFLAGSVWAATGNLAPALAPLQLDFGSGIQLSLRTVLLTALIAATQAGVYIPSAASLERLAHLKILRVDRQGLELTHTESQELAGLAAALHLKLIWADSELIGVGQQEAEPQIGVLMGPGSPTAAYPPAWLKIHWGGQTIQPQQPDIVLLEPSLGKLHWGITIARQAVARVYQNTALISLPNVIAVGAGTLAGLSPLMNVLINNATAALVEFLPAPDFLPPPHPRIY